MSILLEGTNEEIFESVCLNLYPYSWEFIFDEKHFQKFPSLIRELCLFCSYNTTYCMNGVTSIIDGEISPFLDDLTHSFEKIGELKNAECTRRMITVLKEHHFFDDEYSSHLDYDSFQIIYEKILDELEKFSYEFSEFADNDESFSKNIYKHIEKNKEKLILKIKKMK